MDHPGRPPGPKRPHGSSAIGNPMFRSLFSWIILATTPGKETSFACSDTRVTSFNPCSHGSSWVGVVQKRIARRFDRCFNPCSHGSSWAPWRSPAGRDARNEFQSLFSWITLGDGHRRIVRQARVSILVLMDALMTPPLPLHRSTLPMFQSLFSWITLGDCVGHLSHRSAGVTTFQSLFSWIILGDTHPGGRAATGDVSGFNPCSDGSRLGAVDGPPYAQQPWSKLDCFNPCSHGSSWASAHFACASKSMGFNPCSHGSSWATSTVWAWPGPHVSILVLMDHPGRHRSDTEASRDHVLVSILVLLDAALGDGQWSRANSSCIAMFQSLF